MHACGAEVARSRSGCSDWNKKERVNSVRHAESTLHKGVDATTPAARPGSAAGNRSFPLLLAQDKFDPNQIVRTVGFKSILKHGRCARTEKCIIRHFFFALGFDEVD